MIPIENEAALWMTLDFVLYLLFRILRLPGSYTIWGGIWIVLLCLHLKGFQQDSASLVWLMTRIWLLSSTVSTYDCPLSSNDFCDWQQTMQSIILDMTTSHQAIVFVHLCWYVVLCCAECENAVLHKNMLCASKKTMRAAPFTFLRPLECKYIYF